MAAQTRKAPDLWKADGRPKDIKHIDDLRGPGAKPGTVPTDLEQATGLERLEILGKMEGVDIFDMQPLDASRRGTLDNPLMVRSAGEEQYAGCTGFPADSHPVIWLTVRGRGVGESHEREGERELTWFGTDYQGTPHRALP